MNRELEFYNEVKNWDFSKIKYIEECLTNWNMYDILNKTATKTHEVPLSHAHTKTIRLMAKLCSTIACLKAIHMMSSQA